MVAPGSMHPRTRNYDINIPNNKKEGQHQHQTTKQQDVSQFVACPNPDHRLH